MGVKSAFLKGTPLNREFFMEPPTEFKKTGIFWKLKKKVYCLYDESKNGYFAVMAELTHVGMKNVSGDDALFNMIRNEELFSMTVFIVDDFLVAGSSEFL